MNVRSQSPFPTKDCENPNCKATIPKKEYLEFRDNKYCPYCENELQKTGQLPNSGNSLYE